MLAGKNEAPHVHGFKLHHTFVARDTHSNTCLFRLVSRSTLNSRRAPYTGVGLFGTLRGSLYY